MARQPDETWSSADLAEEAPFKLKTLQGSDVKVKDKDGDLFLEGGMAGDDAKVVEADVLTCQGYLHVIDEVLFYDAGDSDGALGKAIGVAAGAAALVASLL